MKNVLVVDDDAKMVESMRIGLLGSGHRVFTAIDARQALDMLGRESCAIDIVVTDYLMPAMNGIELLKALRRSHPCLPVIIMTAYTEKNMVIEARQNRCDSLIEKPFRLEQLISEIERIRPSLHRRTAATDPRHTNSTGEDSGNEAPCRGTREHCKDGKPKS